MRRLPYPGGSTSPDASPFWVTIEIGGAGDRFSAPVQALVDTESTYTWIPRDILEALDITPDDDRLFEHTDGRSVRYPIAWVLLKVAERVQHTLVVFAPAGSELVLGSLTLACFGLAADPPNEALISVPGRL